MRCFILISIIAAQLSLIRTAPTHACSLGNKAQVLELRGSADKTLELFSDTAAMSFKASEEASSSQAVNEAAPQLSPSSSSSGTALPVNLELTISRDTSAIADNSDRRARGRSLVPWRTDEEMLELWLKMKDQPRGKERYRTLKYNNNMKLPGNEAMLEEYLRKGRRRRRENRQLTIGGTSRSQYVRSSSAPPVDFSNEASSSTSRSQAADESDLQKHRTGAIVDEAAQVHPRHDGSQADTVEPDSPWLNLRLAPPSP